MSHTAIGMDLGSRVGWWTRMAWPTSRAKNLARLLGVSESQAKRIISGAAPTSEQIAKMAKAWGWRFIDFVFEGVAGPERPVLAMQAEMDELDRRLGVLELERLAEDERVGAKIAAMARSGESAVRGEQDIGLVRPDEAKADPLKVTK